MHLKYLNYNHKYTYSHVFDYLKFKYSLKLNLYLYEFVILNHKLEIKNDQLILILERQGEKIRSIYQSI